MYFSIKIRYFLLLLCFFIYIQEIKANDFNRNRKIFLENTINKEKQNYYLNRKDENTFDKIKSKIQKKEWLEVFKLNEKIENIGFKEAINTYISLKRFRQISYFSEEEIKDLIIFNTENYFLNDFKNFNNIIEFCNDHVFNHLIRDLKLLDVIINLIPRSNFQTKKEIYSCFSYIILRLPKSDFSIFISEEKISFLFDLIEMNKFVLYNNRK